MSVKLFIGNLSPDTSGDELRALFSDVGVVESYQLITDRDTGRSKGYAFVVMDSKESATTAKEKFNGHVLHGRPLKVNDAQLRNWYQNPAGYLSPRQT